MDPWWTEQGAGIAGAIIGGVGGSLLGGVGGGVCGPLAAKGKARTFVMGFFIAAFLIGVALIGVGVTALALGQPFHVWFWLAMPGVLFAVLSGVMIPTFRARYAHHEQRRIASEELRRG